MQIDSFVLDALDRVLSWELPDEACPDAVTAEAAHLAGMSVDHAEAPTDTPVATHRNAAAPSCFFYV